MNVTKIMLSPRLIAMCMHVPRRRLWLDDMHYRGIAHHGNSQGSILTRRHCVVLHFAVCDGAKAHMLSSRLKTEE